MAAAHPKWKRPIAAMVGAALAYVTAQNLLYQRQLFLLVGADAPLHQNLLKFATSVVASIHQPL